VSIRLRTRHFAAEGSVIVQLIASLLRQTVCAMIWVSNLDLSGGISPVVHLRPVCNTVLNDTLVSAQ